MDIKTLTLPITIILLSGCSSTKTINNCKSGIPGKCPACVELPKQATISRPPPNWPPHEHDSPLYMLRHENVDDRWNHISFEQDPTIDIQ